MFCIGTVLAALVCHFTDMLTLLEVLPYEAIPVIKSTFHIAAFNNFLSLLLAIQGLSHTPCVLLSTDEGEVTLACHIIDIYAFSKSLTICKIS